MICNNCANEADWQKADRPSDSINGHDYCKGCDCQHKPLQEGQISE